MSRLRTGPNSAAPRPEADSRKGREDQSRQLSGRLRSRRECVHCLACHHNGASFFQTRRLGPTSRDGENPQKIGCKSQFDGRRRRCVCIRFPFAVGFVRGQIRTSENTNVPMAHHKWPDFPRAPGSFYSPDADHKAGSVLVEEVGVRVPPLWRSLIPVGQHLREHATGARDRLLSEL